MDENIFNRMFYIERLNRRMSQERFARKLDCSKQAISAIENMRTKPSQKLLTKFLNNFGYKLQLVKTFEKSTSPSSSSLS